GHVDRCEGRPWSTVPSRDCVCVALEKVQLPAAVAGKRAAFDILHEDRDVVTKAGVLNAWFQPASVPVHADLVTCFERDAPAARFRAPVTLTLRPDGAIASVRVGWEGSTPGSATRACVEKVLRATQLPCPTGPSQSSITTELHVETHH
ncbi:MAG: hypothetical protein ABIP39_11825, partial [Polyangiaceae bacterium]